MIYQQGCFACDIALRLAKDLAENNKGARVLVICSEILAIFFRGLSDTNMDNLRSIAEAFSPVGMITNWDSIFYVVHPGGLAILDQMEARLGLEKHKLRASRHVLNEYGNMSSASVFFVMDEMRNKSVEEGKHTTGEGLEWGVLLGFGPGLTLKTVVLHSIPIKPSH
ncbi:hypothetical protein CRYUN_Cryun05aG0196100 [Craigia yunnanensis]